MSITLVNENKNNISLTMENRVISPTWNEDTHTWDESTETWDTQSTLWEKEAKNNISLNLEPKL